MQILLENVVRVANHDHWKVRLQFLEFVKLILFNCTKHLNHSVSTLMPSVMALYVDDCPEITENMKKFILVLTTKLQDSNSISLRSVVEDNIYATTSKLIKCKLLADDKIKLFTLRTLQGYLSVLESSISYVLSSLPHLERIMLCLINFIEFDTTALNIIEEISTSQFDANSPNLWPKKTFVCFQDDEILRTISNIIYLLTKFGHARLLIHYLLEKMECSSLYNLQCVYLIGEIIKSLRHDSKYSEQNIILIDDVLDELLSPKVWEIPLLDDNPQNAVKKLELPENSLVVPPKLYNNNVFQICLILEVIAKSAEALKANFKSFLLKSLSSVMEKAGSSNYIISQSGRLCLYSIAQFCNYNSVFELIKDNADYITNSVTINFHHFHYKPEVALVLRVAMEESDAVGLTLFKDAIYQILKLVDLNQDRAYSLLNILFCTVKCIKKWFPPKKMTQSKNSPKKLEDLVTIMSEYKALKTADFDSIPNVNEDLDDSSNVLCEEEDDSFQAHKKVLPLHINIVTEIFKRCIHFQSSRNLYLRMLALEMAEACVTALSDFEHELHPLVHEFWNPFVQRFAEDTVVVLKAFQVLLVIVDECRDFVLVRTLKDVMPKLISILKQEYKNSLKSNFRNYQWVNAHKLQLLVLSEIGNLCSKLKISEKDLSSVTEVCLPYLNISQPKVLQSAAEKTLKSLAVIDADAVWFYYNEMYSVEQSVNPPHSSLSVICFPNSSGSETNIRMDFP
ncbi:TELO2-interacting protein 1 homolog [Uloborus diversus]|uniref:TELO2-interacting protein 1 homolog n=1 Tax=Uloborus diversus TaxID=327109 RepID=UPI002409312C|nr:TELO2-interacting protein 1 homolog [Uloborus diversus]